MKTTNKTLIEELTKEFHELDRVTPRPLTKEDYAIAAVQFLKNELVDKLDNIKKWCHHESGIYKDIQSLIDDLNP